MLETGCPGVCEETELPILASAWMTQSVFQHGDVLDLTHLKHPRVFKKGVTQTLAGLGRQVPALLVGLCTGASSKEVSVESSQNPKIRKSTSQPSAL